MLLNRKVDAKEGKPLQIEPEIDPEVSGVGRTVWVVEDDEPIARCLQLLLQESGYRVDVARSLGEARTLATLPELVLLDYLLPDGNGISYLPELAREHPGVPVILLTALERVGNSSFPNHVTYLAKPFRNRDLIELVHSRFTAKPPPAVGA